jgi:hypothetical protein
VGSGSSAWPLTTELADFSEFIMRITHFIVTHSEAEWGGHPGRALRGPIRTKPGAE